MEITKEVIDAVKEKLKADGFNIRTAEEDKSYLEAHSQPAIDRVFSERNKQLEDLVAQELEIGKNTDEKWFDHFKRAVGTTKQQIAEMKSKIKEYESKGVNGEALVEEYKNRLETLKEQYEKEKEELSGKVQNMSKEMFSAKVDMMFNNTLDKIKDKFDPSNPYLADVIQNRKSKFLSDIKPKDLEGNIVWQKDGKTLLSQQDGTPIGIEGAMMPYFEDLIQKGKKQGGAGSGGTGDEGEGGEGAADHGNRPEEIKTQIQLHDHLVGTLKMNPSSREFSDLFAKWKDGLKLR